MRVRMCPLCVCVCVCLYICIYMRIKLIHINYTYVYISVLNEKLYFNKFDKFWRLLKKMDYIGI